MKFNIWSIIFIVLGIICIFIAITSFGNQKYANRIVGRILILGIILILISLVGMVPNWRSDYKKEAEKFNFRETDSKDNCRKCSRFDVKSFDGFEAHCKFFHIKTDVNHACDLLKPQLDENISKSNTKNSNKHIVKYKDLLRKIR
jgi:hypothetical protein